MIALAAAALLGAVPGRAGLPASQVKVDDVVRILRAKEAPTPADLARAGDAADRVLVDLLVAKSVDTDVRLKAARALAGYPGTRSRAVLSTLIPNPVEPPELRAVAMVSLARIGGPGAVDDLRPWLKDGDDRLRIGAAQALGVIADVRACGLLADAMEHEEVLEVRLAIDEGTKACRNGGKP